MFVDMGVLPVCLQSEGHQMWLHVSLLLKILQATVAQVLFFLPLWYTSGEPYRRVKGSRISPALGCGDLRNRLLMETSPSGTAVSKFNTCTICVESRHAPLKPSPSLEGFKLITKSGLKCRRVSEEVGDMTGG